MSWNCSNTCNVISTHIAQQIVDAKSPQTLELVHFTDINGNRFTIKDAPCLKIILDLKNGGGFVLEQVNVLLDNLAFVRGSMFTSDAVMQVQCAALCPSPFDIQLSSDVELIACVACDPCPPDLSWYLKFIIFLLILLGLLLLWWFLSDKSTTLWDWWHRCCSYCSNTCNDPCCPYCTKTTICTNRMPHIVEPVLAAQSCNGFPTITLIPTPIHNNPQPIIAPTFSANTVAPIINSPVSSPVIAPTQPTTAPITSPAITPVIMSAPTSTPTTQTNNTVSTAPPPPSPPSLSTAMSDMTLTVTPPFVVPSSDRIPMATTLSSDVIPPTSDNNYK